MQQAKRAPIRGKPAGKEYSGRFVRVTKSVEYESGKQGRVVSTSGMGSERVCRIKWDQGGGTINAVAVLKTVLEIVPEEDVKPLALRFDNLSEFVQTWGTPLDGSAFAVNDERTCATTGIL